jgi:hypothetical protein
LPKVEAYLHQPVEHRRVHPRPELVLEGRPGRRLERQLVQEQPLQSRQRPVPREDGQVERRMRVEEQHLQQGREGGGQQACGLRRGDGQVQLDGLLHPFYQPYQEGIVRRPERRRLVVQPAAPTAAGLAELQHPQPRRQGRREQGPDPVVRRLLPHARERDGQVGQVAGLG